jgi:hypothetical protein
MTLRWLVCRMILPDSLGLVLMAVPPSKKIVNNFF